MKSFKFLHIVTILSCIIASLFKMNKYEIFFKEIRLKALKWKVK